MLTGNMISRLLLFVALLISLTVSTPVKQLPSITRNRAFRAGLDGRKQCPARPASGLSARPRLQRRAKDMVNLPGWIQTPSEVASFFYGMSVMECICLKLNQVCFLLTTKMVDNLRTDEKAAHRRRL